MNKLYNSPVVMNNFKIYIINTYKSFLVTSATCISFHDPESGEKGILCPEKVIFRNKRKNK